MKKNITILLLIVLFSSTLSFSLLTRGHLWWDDFAGYLMQARSIIAGDMAGFIQHSTISVEKSSAPPGPIAYPWGFPLKRCPTG